RRHRPGAIARGARRADRGRDRAGYEVSGWTGIGVPAGTPAAIVAALNREINAGLADARIAARLAEVGGRPILVTPDQFGQLWLRDTDKWAQVVKFAAAKRGESENREARSHSKRTIARPLEQVPASVEELAILGRNVPDALGVRRDGFTRVRQEHALGRRRSPRKARVAIRSPGGLAGAQSLRRSS